MESIPIGDLVPYDKNSRTHTAAQVALIEASMREFGWTSPVLTDENLHVLAGHGRIMAAKSLGLESCPVLRIEGLTDAQKRAYVIADNKITEVAGWDDDLLTQELTWLQDEGFDLQLTGFSEKELDSLLGSGPDPGGSGGQDESGQLKSIFEILIECTDEQHQLELLERLEGEGVECRALVS